MGSVYVLTIRQLTGRWRLIIMATLATLPVIMSIFALRQADAPTVLAFENVVVSSMLTGSILPLVVLAIAAAAFANEIEDRTIANLTLSPIPRWQIALPKLLAIITIASPFIAVSAFLTSHIAFLADAKATMAVVGASLIGLAMYASMFTWLGLVSGQAIGVGLLYVVLWEGLFARFVAGVRLLSIRYFSIDLMHGFDERRFAGSSHLGLVAVLTIAAVIIGGFMFLSVRRLRRMDVP
jgi:hypothetical protein